MSRRATSGGFSSRPFLNWGTFDIIPLWLESESRLLRRLFVVEESRQSEECLKRNGCDFGKGRLSRFHNDCAAYLKKRQFNRIAYSDEPRRRNSYKQWCSERNDAVHGGPRKRWTPEGKIRCGVVSRSAGMYCPLARPAPGALVE
jgi:hypothetical protein